MSTQPTEPFDCIGNKLEKDSFVTVLFKTVPIFKVVAIENGGIHTANGITPAKLRIICDMTLIQVPGRPFESILKAQNPNNQALIEAIAGSLPKG